MVQLNIVGADQDDKTLPALYAQRPSKIITAGIGGSIRNLMAAFGSLCRIQSLCVFLKQSIEQRSGGARIRVMATSALGR